MTAKAAGPPPRPEKVAPEKVAPEKVAPEKVAPEKAALELENLVTYRVSLVAKLVERRLAKLVSRFDLAVAEYRVLGQIAMRPGCTVREISARTLVDKAQVSRSIAALEQRELVTRSVPSNDRRSPVLFATRSGRAVIRKIAPLRQEQEREILADMSPSNVEGFDHNLRELFERLNAPSADPARVEPAETSPRRARRSDQPVPDPAG